MHPRQLSIIGLVTLVQSVSAAAAFGDTSAPTLSSDTHVAVRREIPSDSSAVYQEQAMARLKSNFPGMVLLADIELTAIRSPGYVADAPWNDVYASGRARRVRDLIIAVPRAHLQRYLHAIASAGPGYAAEVHDDGVPLPIAMRVDGAVVRTVTALVPLEAFRSDADQTLREPLQLRSLLIHHGADAETRDLARSNAVSFEWHAKRTPGSLRQLRLPRQTPIPDLKVRQAARTR